MIVLFSLVACQVDSGATVVGNPGTRATSQVAPSEGFQYRSAEMYLNYISYIPQDPNAEELQIEVATMLDLLDPTSSFSLLEGNWQSIALQLTSCYSETCPSNWVDGEYPIMITGQDPEGQDFQLDLTVDRIVFSYDNGYNLRDQQIVELASPEWLSNQDLADAEQISELIRTTSTLHADQNKNGILDSSER